MPILELPTGSLIPPAEFDKEFEQTIERIKLLYNIAKKMEHVFSQSNDCVNQTDHSTKSDQYNWNSRRDYPRKFNEKSGRYNHTDHSTHANNQYACNTERNLSTSSENKSLFGRPLHPWAFDILDLILESNSFKVPKSEPDTTSSPTTTNSDEILSLLHEADRTCKIPSPLCNCIQHEVMREYTCQSKCCKTDLEDRSYDIGSSVDSVSLDMNFESEDSDTDPIRKIFESALDDYTSESGESYSDENSKNNNKLWNRPTERDYSFEKILELIGLTVECQD